jgi:lysozyme
MSEPIKPMIVDLSHWDPADDYDAVKADGIVGVIYKATQGTGFTDDTYVAQQKAAKAAGLKWGCYHFAEATNVDQQVANFLRFAAPDPDELFCLDWEDYGSNTMSADQAKDWIEQVEGNLGRPGQCVIYSGNTAKELLEVPDEFFGSRRLWLAQYGSTPTPHSSWQTYWLWQFTDGEVGPTPHSIDGIGRCDINSYAGTAEQLIAEWATGRLAPPTPQPRQPHKTVTVSVDTPEGVKADVIVNGIPIRRIIRNLLRGP